MKRCSVFVDYIVIFLPCRLQFVKDSYAVAMHAQKLFSRAVAGLDAIDYRAGSVMRANSQRTSYKKGLC